ncbi:DUF4179 domain-containing protein [Sporosarcina koreensis]|uniref:DUF4179 domain-containing protein n=1 Tax=Sporosarcina koreensis TaxID=334735 RepID=UPI000756DF1D|nr:DUF4179 domain-containing protein [Sporosarcina koreensis]
MKTLYKQFDRQKLNIDQDIQPMEVTDLEKANIKRAVMRGRKRKNHLPRNLSVAAAFFIASGITLGAAFPTLAAKLPIVGNFFELFVDDDNYVFEKFDSFSTDIGVTKESNGIRVTVTDAVYDGENIAIAYTIEGEQEFGTKPILEGAFHAEEFGDSYEHYGFHPEYITKKISDTEYAGLFIYQLIEGPKPDEIHATWKGDSILDVWNVKNEFPGDWTFNLTLQALNGEETKSFTDAGITSEADGVHVALTKMTKTPITTTLYLSENVDVRTAALEDEEWRGALLTYVVTDDLGNEYNAIHYKDTGHSTDFRKEHRSVPRITTTTFHEDATSITITPYVNVYKFINDEDVNEGPLELAKEPYAIESMVFDLK